MLDSLILRIAKNLTKEVTYRGFRGVAASAFTPVAKPSSGKERVRVSIAKSNVLGAIFYSIVSFSASLPLLALREVRVPATDVFSVSLTVLIGFAFALSLMQVTPFTSTFIREGLVDLLRLLPLTDSQILKAYFTALILYWGGLSLAFIFIPFFAVSTYVAVEGALPGTYLLLGLFAAVTTLTFSYSLGMALGSYSYAVRRRASLRVMSTLAWLLSFMMMFLLYRASSIMIEAAKALEPALRAWGALIPFVGPLFSAANPILMLGSVGESALLVTVAYVLARRRVSKVFLGGVEYVVVAKAQPSRRVGVGEAGLRVGGLIGAMIRKDFKLLSREPRRLAGMLFLVLLPVIMSVPVGSGSLMTRYSTYMVLFVSSFLGAFSGLASDHVFYAEGAGALLLYHLPIRRYDVALAKALTCSLITLPISVTVVGGLAAYFTGDALLTACGVAIAVMLNLGFSFINSAITMSMLPSTPSEWSEYSFRASMGARFARGAVKLVVTGVGAGVPLVMVLLAPFMGASPTMTELLALTYAVASLATGLTLLRIAAGLKPL